MRPFGGGLRAAGSSGPERGHRSLVAPMITGERELIAGIASDPQFGPTVMVGMGVLAEAIRTCRCASPRSPPSMPPR
ncbi:MAG: acetate--CoA ligase family protein [Microthrixaceae bacterium]